MTGGAESMRAFRLAYDGRPFRGFQRQPDVPTVEGALFDALAALGVADGKPAMYAAAGRTDAGASALAQTVGFASPEWLAPRALNAELPSTVRAWASADVSADFHATHDARHRTYRYFLYAPDAGVGRAREALAACSGERDFHNLTPDDEGTVRDLSAAVERDGAHLVFRLRAPGFARQLVRRLVSLVHAVAAGETPLETVERALAPEPLDGPEGIAPAPAYPLVLADVAYEGVAFEVDERAAADARERFGASRAERATLARVAGEIEAGVDT